MANSTTTLQNIVDDAMAYADLAPSLSASGYSDAPAISIANDTMQAMIQGGEAGQPLNWKWNRIVIPQFYTNIWQQDYFIPGLFNLAWLEYGFCVDINNTSQPKPKLDLEMHRDLSVTYMQTGFPWKVCWLPVFEMLAGTWGAIPVGTTGNLQIPQIGGNNPSGQFNPGPGSSFINPIGQPGMPNNPSSCVEDAFGNFWVVTGYGQCGNTNPFATNLNPVFPTYSNPNVVATTALDGTVTWTAVGPNTQGIRLNPVPPQNGIVWQINLIGQKRPPVFKSLGQTLEPIPDDYVAFFKQGFFAYCHRRSADPKIRAKFSDEWKLWMEALNKSVKSGANEMDDYGFYPGSGVMDTGWGVWNYPNPAQPFRPWGY
jgi:hypothetical protein